MSMSFDLFERETLRGPLSILTICTGNVCRSPLAEMILRSELAELPVVVASAGTHALVGESMTEQNQAIARAAGVADVASHSARQVSSELLDSADLILALSREHRKNVVELSPRSTRKVFTLREFGRLADVLVATGQTDFSNDDPGARMRDAVASVSQTRGTIPPLLNPEDDDVVDPYRRSDEIYTRSAGQLRPAVWATSSLLRRAAEGRR